MLEFDLPGPFRLIYRFASTVYWQHHLNHQNSYKNTFITIVFLLIRHLIIITVIPVHFEYAVAFFALAQLIFRLYTHTRAHNIFILAILQAMQMIVLSHAVYTVCYKYYYCF